MMSEQVKAALIIGVSLIESNVRTLKCLGPTLHVRSALALKTKFDTQVDTLPAGLLRKQ